LSGRLRHGVQPRGLATLKKGDGVVTANATLISARGSFTNAATGFG
jgi:hypothetical protein